MKKLTTDEARYLRAFLGYWLKEVDVYPVGRNFGLDYGQERAIHELAYTLMLGDRN